MKSAFVAAVLVGVSTATALSQPFNDILVFTDYSLGITGTNSDFSSITPVGITELDDDFQYSSIGTSREATTDLGAASVRASTFAGHPTVVGFPGEPSTLGPAVMGLQVAASARITRPPLFSGATGNIQTTGLARARFRETLTFHTPTNTFPFRVEGYLNLHGSMNASADATVVTEVCCQSMQASSHARITVTGNVLRADYEKAIFATAGISDPPPIREAILFAFDTLPDSRSTIDLSMELSGSASVGGPGFPVPHAGFALAQMNANYSRTLSWGGITKVTQHFTGQPILDWSVTSASGFDYSQVFSIPEPSAGMLLLVGLGSICLSKRRILRAA